MINVNINLTSSKILAYLILLVGSIYSFAFNDAGVMIATFTSAGSVIAIKTVMEARERTKT